jgi:hypothetical protein
MGDKQRFNVFAQFIQSTFPRAIDIADIAGGHGELSFWLHELGKRPVVIDPRDAVFPRWVRRRLRKRAMRTGAGVTIARMIASVEQVDLSRFDLLVALHPDEATEPALRAALHFGIDFAIVPCCVFAIDGVGRSRSEWVAYLASQAPGIQSGALPLDGANIVLWHKHVLNALPITGYGGVCQL